jgi:hypothetical protein
VSTHSGDGLLNALLARYQNSVRDPDNELGASVGDPCFLMTLSDAERPAGASERTTVKERCTRARRVNASGALDG